MLSADKKQKFDAIQSSYSRAELIWLHGFLTGSLFPATTLPSLVAVPAQNKTLSGTIISKINLHDTGSAGQTHHIEIEAPGASYNPGDYISFSINNSPNATGKKRYPVSSSPEAHSGEIHVTIPADIEELVCDKPVEFLIHADGKFAPPEENTDLIMIGSGAGIAPFRSLLSHRDATGASGRNWLFFGEKNFISDFLYQTDLQLWAETGGLTRMNTAFTDEKMALAQKILIHAKEIINWLNHGAHLYINTAAENELQEVIGAFRDIDRQNNTNPGKPSSISINELEKQGRYQAQWFGQ